MKVVAITGGLGFLGRHMVEELTTRGDRIVVIDAETYAADLRLLTKMGGLYLAGSFHYVKSDICTLDNLPDVDVVINFAAETHVDNSLTDPARFLRSNVMGVQRLLDLVRGKRAYQMPTFIQISTDEVYGDYASGAATESSPLAPSSPYAASKAAADHLIMAYGRSYGVPWRIIRPSNCYGQHQYHEKLIPKAIRHLTLGRPIPIHEDGTATRSWLHVQDCARAIRTVMDEGRDGEVYNISGNTELSVRDVATLIVQAFHGEADPAPYLAFQHQRLGLDRRYHVDDTKLRGLGWEPKGNLAADIPVIVAKERKLWRW